MGDVAADLEAHMAKHRMTIEDAAREIGIAKSTLSQILRRETVNPSPRTMAGVMGFLARSDFDHRATLTDADRARIRHAVLTSDVQNKSALAREAGVHPQRIYDLLACRRKVSYDTCSVILDALGLSIEQVLAEL